MDGAMGTMISSPEKDSLNLTSPELIRSIHRQYLDAGADIIKTNTFNSNAGPQDYEVNLAGARLARAMADEFTAANPSRPRYVAGAMGPGRDGAASADAYFEQARALTDGGVDFLLVETITSISTAQSALTALHKLPVMLSVTISEDGNLISGESLNAFCSAVSHAKLFSVGINCGLGVRHVRPFAEQLSRMTPTKISCHPSAGLPNANGGYDETPEEFAAILGGLASEGHADIVGGCCGTTPAHIRAIAEAVRGISRATIERL